MTPEELRARVVRLKARSYCFACGRPWLDRIRKESPQVLGLECGAGHKLWCSSEVQALRLAGTALAVGQIRGGEE